MTGCWLRKTGFIRIMRELRDGWIVLLMPCTGDLHILIFLHPILYNQALISLMDLISKKPTGLMREHEWFK